MFLHYLNQQKSSSAAVLGGATWHAVGQWLAAKEPSAAWHRQKNTAARAICTVY